MIFVQAYFVAAGRNQLRRFLLPSNRSILTGLSLVVASLSLLLISCSGPAMRGEFRSYNTAYADALNEQMLLNLARLENGHPAYYLAIGAINNKFTDTVSAAAGSAGTAAQNTDTSTRNTPLISGTPTAIASFPLRVAQSVSQTLFGYSASGAVAHTSSPDFQFIPLNNEAATKQVLDPISTDVFFTLYQQGYPIDQLMRVLIERVEASLPDTSEQLVLVNSPTRGTPKSYARFLRLCAILREMQRAGYLSLEAHRQFDVLGSIAFDSQKGERTKPTSKEFADAEEKGFTLQEAESGWQIGRMRSSPLFVLKQENAEAVVKHLMSTKNLIAPNPSSNAEAISRVVDLLGHGISVQTKVETGGHAGTRLILRSFGRAMDAVATEQPAFEKFETEHNDTSAIVPPLELHPVLQMMWPDKSISLTRPLQTVHYNGKTYQIADPVMSPLDPNAHWNRDVFKLMVALGSQVTVDISKFQRQVFELRTD
jgi:hypothetical protein